jgi:signal transduction histidine kinase
LHLDASTAPTATRLPALEASTPDNELDEKEIPLPDVVSQERLIEGHRYWLITVTIKDPDGSGYVSALILKNPKNALASHLQLRHNLVLGGAIIISVILLYLLFVYFFRRPARDIVHAMARAEAGDLSVRSVVRREDELGEIARGFNRMIDELSERDYEREELLTQIRGFNRNLRVQIEVATKDLRAADEKILQTQQRLARYERLAAIGQLSASLAHEIGTPLNAISGHLQLLGEKFPADAEVKRRVAIVHKQLDSIVGIVRKLLQRTHKRQSRMEPTDLNVVISEVLQLTKPALDAHRVIIDAALAPNLPLVLADRDSLQQVFLNLINNSMDAMPDGGRFEIATTLNDKERAVELLFLDSGKGIPVDALEHLFEPLWTTKDAGTGFGLAIAREIMKEHDGSIEVIQGTMEGAAFRLTLPIIESRAASATKEKELSHAA